MTEASGLVTVRTSTARRAVLALCLSFLAIAPALPAAISISGCTIEGNAALMYCSSVEDLLMEGNTVSDYAEGSGE